MECQKKGCNKKAEYAFVVEIKPEGEDLFDVEIYLCEGHYLNCFEIDIYNEAITKKHVLDHGVIAPSYLV